MRKLTLVALAAVLLLLVGAAALALVDFDSPALGQAALSAAGDATGMALGAKSYRLNLLDGLVADGVTAAGTVPGGRYAVELDRLVFEHRLWPLLRGTVAVESIRVEGAKIELVATAKPAGASSAPDRDAAPVAAVPAGAGLSLLIGEIALRDARVALRDETGETAPVDVEGLDLVLRDLALDPAGAAPLAGVNARGRLEIARVALEGTEVREAAGDFSVEGGRLVTQDVSFRTPEGRFGVDLGVELSRVPLRYEMALRGDPLDLNRASGSPGGLGPARFSLDAVGRGTDAAGLKGKGRVSLAEGALPEHPVLLALERVTGVAGIAGARYEASQADFRVADARLQLEPLILRSGDTALDLSGAIGLDRDQTLDLRLALLAPRAGVRVEGVGDAVLDALVDAEGRVRIPLRVTGPSQSPRVLPDTGALIASARRGGARALGDRASGGLKKLLGRQ